MPWRRLWQVRDRRAWRPTTRAVREDTVAAPAGDPSAGSDTAATVRHLSTA